MQRRIQLSILTLTVALLTGSAVAGQVASNSATERFTANAVNISNVGRTGATPLDIVIERWSTDSERDRLMERFKSKGPDALLEALRDLPRVGYLRTPESIGYDLHYARQMPGEDGGRRIVLMTDRPISFWEARNRPRTIDYPFTLIEMRMDGDGRGEGKLSIATKITLNGDVLVLEDYANQPVMLNDIRKQR
jgi:hypothetical protein